MTGQTLPILTRNQEHIIPPEPSLKIPRFQGYQFPQHGDAILLVIPTGNPEKKRIIEEWMAKQAPQGSKVYTSIIAADSGVGNQPYNRAGPDGAHNRIENALCLLADSDIFEKQKIGTVIAVSIESYIRTDPSPPADFGMVVWHNATTGTTHSCCTEGVTVPAEYLEYARSFGSTDDDPDHGKVPVGSVMADRQPDIDEANWHECVAGRSRYELLGTAMDKMANPFSTGE